MLHALTLAATFLPATGTDPPPDPLAGAWIVVSTTNAGKDDDQLKGFTATFNDGKLTFKSKDGKEHAATYTLDTLKKPAAIDLVPADGPHEGMTLKGIFALEKRRLKLCLGKEGEDRPTAFRSAAGDQTLLFILQRRDERGRRSSRAACDRARPLPRRGRHRPRGAVAAMAIASQPPR